MYASALTDPLISGIAKGSEQYKLVGSYVTAPLNWYVKFPVLTGISAGLMLIDRAVITGKNSKYNSITDLQGTTIGISRLGRWAHFFLSVETVMNTHPPYCQREPDHGVRHGPAAGLGYDQDGVQK